MLDRGEKTVEAGTGDVFIDAHKRLPLRDQWCDNCRIWQPLEGNSGKGDCSVRGRACAAGSWCGGWR